MANLSSDAHEKEISLGADLIIPVAGLCFGAYYVSTVWGLPWQASSLGISLMTALVLVSVLLGLRFVREYRNGLAALTFGDLFGETTGVLMRRIGLALLTCGFVYSMNYLGFTISLFIFVVSTVIMLAGPGKIKIALAIATGMSLGGYLLFIVLVGARFPHGPFERVAAMLFQS
ncbi:hypothetical protein IMCC20628_02015 [Hoeflea sp. IMCC20628]|uniref:tripartite tricarboxylate transporter TctB family protein n=1 Tax=Hoeflea sp. IMCC20628 TaxID=1620421 RepID=UPI00063AE8A3|nr:tripartite tricarboxylate transporter TctB family protein [Hoeflea sp. IMCC20628]AKI00719.1 hypothetical protein IMCC20628_02015 [Hoeflea sp. IMCC20628]